MRMSQAEKEKSHARIVDSAARLLRERGVEGTSVADVMGAAGLTNGGFYRHFETKEALLGAALEAAFAELVQMVESRLDLAPPEAVAEGFGRFYLSADHVDAAGSGCPIAAVGAEIGRASEALKETFGAGVRRMVTVLARTFTERPAAERQKAATRRLAMMAGAVMIARASDPATAKAVLSACRSV